MKIKTLIWLALSVLFLASVVYILDHRPVAQETVSASSRVFDITTEPITLMGMIRGDERIELVRKDDDWFLQSPIRARGRNLILHQLAAQAERLRSLDTITAEQRAVRNLSLADYGLDQPVGAFYLEAGGRREKVSFGARTPFGSEVYGFRHDTDTVIVLPEESLNLIEPSLDALRDRSLFAGSKRRVTRVDLYRQDLGFLQLVRRGGSWQIQQPMVWPADSDAVDQLLEALYVIQVQRFVWDAPADSEDGLQSPAFRSQVEEGNLAPDQAQTRLTIWVEGSDTGEELFLGRAYENGGQLYARRWGVPSVFTVPELLGEIASQHVDTFRDNRVVRSSWKKLSQLSLEYQDHRLTLERQSDVDWALREPVQNADNVRIDAVDELLQAFKDLRIESFEPETDVDTSLMFAAKAVFPNDVPEDHAHHDLYLVPVEGEGGDEYWVGRIGEDGDFWRMSGFVSHHTVKDLMHPARYRSRRILSIDHEELTHVQQTTAQGDVTVRREDNNDNTWVLAKPEDRQLEDGAFDLLLAALEQLDAEVVADYEPDSLRPYGLHSPVTTLTMRFSNRDRLQQSLLIGESEDGEVYARLQGHGYIFQMSDEDEQILQGQLLSPIPEPEPEEEPDAEPEESEPVDEGDVSEVETDAIFDAEADSATQEEDADIPLLLLEDIESNNGI